MSRHVVPLSIAFNLAALALSAWALGPWLGFAVWLICFCGSEVRVTDERKAK